MNESINDKRENRLRLYLMRHGEIERGVSSVCYGHSDVALSARGMEQSNRLCEALKAINLAAVYSSDLARARHAADLIARAHELKAISLPALREINMGEWEGQTIEEVRADNPEMAARLFLDPRGFRYPGGESFSEFERRVGKALQEILAGNESGDIAIVTHGGVCRLILGSVLELAPRNWLRLSQNFGCINIIDWQDGLPTVKRMNCAGFTNASSACLP